MPETVDLRAEPYGLSDQQVAWVEDTLAGLSVREKVGQLFVNLFYFGDDTFGGNELSNAEILAKYHVGGARYHGGSSEQVQELLNSLQRDSKIPLLIAAICDSGGNGARSDGTYIACGAQSCVSRTGPATVRRSATSTSCSASTSWSPRSGRSPSGGPTATTSTPVWR